MKFRKKPVIIEAIRYDGKNGAEISHWMGKYFYTQDFLENHLEIETSEGVLNAQVGDWIIRGIKGEFYPCKPDIFEQTYEPVKREDE